MIYTKVSQDAIDTLQLNAGCLLSTFDVNNPYTPPASENIIATTTGGINPTCEPEFEDFGEDIDNVPNNMKEFKQRTGWNCAMSFTSIKFNAENTAWGLGSSETSTLTNGVKKIVPKRDVSLTDFKDIWWVGDKVNGGAFAVRLMNALSTGGLNMQSTKNGKGTIQMKITGHVSIDAQDTVPMEFYDIPAPEDSEDTTHYSVTQTLTHITSSYTLDTAQATDFEAELTADSGYQISSVVVTMGGTDITATAYDDSDNSIAIAEVTAPIEIIATATEIPSP